MRITKTQKNSILLSFALILFCTLTCAAVLLLRSPVSASAADSSGDFPIDSEISNIVPMSVIYTPNLSISGTSILSDYYIKDGSYTGTNTNSGAWIFIDYRVNGGTWTNVNSSGKEITMTANPVSITSLSLTVTSTVGYIEFRARVGTKATLKATEYGAYGAVARYDLVSVTSPFINHDFSGDNVIVSWTAGTNDEQFNLTIRTSLGNFTDTFPRMTDRFMLFDYLNRDTLYTLTGNITIEITAVNNSDIYPVSKTGKLVLSIIRLAKPTLTATDGVLSWNSVQGASFYKIYYYQDSLLYSDYFTIKTTSIDALKLGLAPGSYSFAISACANGIQIPVPESSPLRFASPMSSSVTSGATYWLVQSNCRIVFGNTDLEVGEYAYGEIVELPDPVKDGYAFEGWYTDKNLTQAFTSNFLTSDTVLYAKWRPLTFGEKLGNFFARNWGWFVLGFVVLGCGTLFILKKTGVIGK